MSSNSKLDSLLQTMPVVAIIRGVTPDEVVEIGEAIYSAGIKVIEVPLNSPNPFNSIAKLSEHLGAECVIGCGTLLSKSNAKKVAAAGGELAVTPNSNPAVIKRCIKLGMTPVPGWATPSEAFTAYKAGARYLKLFPASTYGCKHVKAIKDVLPADAKILAVGGVGAKEAAQWLAAGVDGFGMGSEIYRAGRNAEDVHQRCLNIVAAINSAKL